ncbi:hypothetical protein RhiLY_07615 [Ceratobasidium sp. AG-Ba]|nr:hypothetical protein RhiLY_07615 [Ceratobasidium sp. AG-Ba]
MPEPASRIVYFTLQLFGLVTLPILAFTLLFCPSIKRHPTLANNALVWTLSSFVGSLLLLTRRLNGPEPPSTLCKAQSALMLGQPSGVAVAAVAIVWKVWSLSWGIKRNSAAPEEPLWLTCILLGGPYAVWGILAGVFAILQSKSKVKRSLFYCISDDQNLGVVSGVLAAVFLVFCVVLQVWIVALVYQRFRKSRRLGRAEIGDMPVPFFIRIMAFTTVAFVALVLCFVATWTFTLELPDLIVSSIGVAMFFIFGSQEDVLVAWGIVRPKPRSTISGASGNDGRDAYTAHVRRPLSPGWSIGPSVAQSQVSSTVDLSMDSKHVHRLTMQDDSIELSDTKPRYLQDSSICVV